MWYTVYDTKTDDVLTNGTASQCAKNLGLSENAFRTIFSRQRRTGKNTRFEIIAEKISREELEMLLNGGE